MAYNIADLLEHAVDLMPERVAVVCGQRLRTFGELEHRANRVAHYFAAQGITAGAHVGIYSRNSVEYVETMIALFKLRAVPININYRYTAEELAYLFDDADLQGLVHERQYAEPVAQARTPEMKHLVVVEDGSATDYDGVEYEQALAQGSAERDFGRRSSDDVYVIYTGGTTGMPKGVVWRQEDVWRVLGGGIDFRTGAPVLDEWEPATLGSRQPPSVFFPVAPLMHGAGQWAALGAWCAGGTVVLVPKFDAAEIWRTIAREQVTRVSIVGDAMARPMIEAYCPGEHDASSLVALTSSAAVFSPSVKQQFRDAFPELVIRDAVGSSETGLTGIGGGAAGGDGLRVHRDSATIVIDDRGRPVPPGVVGRMARSGQVPLRYHKDPVKSAAAFIDVDGVRYAVPGDMARIEDDGSMTLLGRGSGCINSGGEKIFPEEVEAALKAHATVFDALVVGKPDERFGQRVVAVVQPRAGAEPTLAELDGFLRTRLAGYKIPRELHLVAEVRRMPSGKPDYRWAHERVRSSRSGELLPSSDAEMRGSCAP